MNKVWMAASVSLLSLTAVGAEPVTFGDLLKEMTDLTVLAELPEPAFTCRQFSSYDRRSTDPHELTDENWFANGDRGQHIRSEERNGATEWVLMDADGPGAVVRIWSANPSDAGVVRVYLDASETPVIEMPLVEMLSGQTFPFVAPIAGERSRGWNSHLPIPYAKHCKITCSQPDFYYHVNYRTYEPGTAVETYSTDSAMAHRDAIESVAKRLAAVPLASSDAIAPLEVVAGTVAPGAAKEFDYDRAGAIVKLHTKVEAADMAGALRGCWLEMYFDGEAAPSVAAPLGDFYGTAPGLNEYQSLVSGVLVDGWMYSNWVMPFEKRARIRLTNHTQDPMDITMFAIVDGYAWNDRSLHFNAAWRAQNDIPTIPRQDWNYIEVTGAGRFVGDSLHVANPVAAWWGEGDEKIYVDGETFPSHFGTGSEDYYGYAWCCPDTFTHAYHNQPRCDGPGNYGHTNVSRFHVLDVIPFTESFKFDIEIWHSRETKVSMAATSYWYEAPGSSDNRPSMDLDLLRVNELPPIPRIEGAIEGEGLAVVSKSGGETRVQEGASWDWSNFAQLWWTGASEADQLVLGFPVEKPGSYEIEVVLTKARDYGIVTLAVNDAGPGAPIDLYNPDVIASPVISLGTHELSAGQNTLTVKLIGMNSKAVPARMFGIDYMKLIPK